jgi:amino acid transporter
VPAARCWWFEANQQKQVLRNELGHGINMSEKKKESLSFKDVLFGKPKDPLDPRVFHRVSLAAFLAWVGLGSDGLSSSAYGPEEAFRGLGDQHYLAVGLVLATALTIFVIAYAYSRIIEHFPFGGGGYIVATKLLGSSFGVVSGSALVVDYVLTISVSIAAAADAIFSFLPHDWHLWKLAVEFVVIALFLVMNLRGVKESVAAIAPIFLLFIVTHAVVILGTILLHLGVIPAVIEEVRVGFQNGVATVGWGGLAALFLYAYTRGAGTYTGIEAVSNGLQIMREPTVQTGKKTMLYMATSLAVTAGGILVCYLLIHAQPSEGKTMNAVLVESFAAGFNWAGLPLGHWLVIATLASEGAILFIAAQTGLIDGPRVMANMAADSWLPHRFAHLSERLTVQNGVILISAAAGLTLLYTQGETTTLVLMYSINVFLTFSLSESGMVRYWIRHRKEYPDWWRHIIIHITGLVLCLSILSAMIVEKFSEGGWVTMVITTGFILLCYTVRSHYDQVRNALKKLDETLINIPFQPDLNPVPSKKPSAPTAVLVARAFDGIAIHSLLNVHRLFPNQFKNVVFISVGVIDSGQFKGLREIENLRKSKEEDLKSLVEFANCLGWYAEYRCSLGVDLLEELEKLCKSVTQDFPRSVFFAGKLVFKQESFFGRLLHNQTPFALQQRLYFNGLDMMILPIRVFSSSRKEDSQVSAARITRTSDSGLERGAEITDAE